MLLTLTLGRRYAEHVVVISTDIDNVELDPDQIFQAANRIDDVPEDERGLAHAWQRRVRRLIDEHQAPSMSVGDTAELCSDDGMYLGGWLCEPVGWTIIDRSVA